MRSAVPKHFHPILGRRMVDWVIETGRATGADPLVVVASPAGARRVRRERRHGRGAGDSRSAPATRCARARARSPATTGDVLVLSGDTPLLTARAPRASSSPTHRARGRGRDGPHVEPPDPRVYGRIVRDAGRRRAARSSRAPTRRRRSARSARSTRRSTSSAADALWPALERLQPKNAQGELYLTDAIEILVGAGEKVGRARRAPTRARPRASTRASSSRTPAPILRDRINEAHMLAGVTIVDPSDDLDRADRRARARRRRSIRSPSCAAPRASPTGAEIGANTVAIDAAHRGRRDRRALLLPSPRHGPRRVLQGGHLRGDQELDASATERRCRTCRTSATPRSARTRTSAPARSPPTSRTSPASRRAARRSAATSGPGSTMASLRRSRSETEHGSQPDR